MAQLPENTNTTLHKIDQSVLTQAEDWRRPHLGASMIGNTCNRALWYGFHWCKAPEFSAQQLRLFARGQREEDIFVKLLRDAGVTVTTIDQSTGKQYSFSDLGGHVGGSLDGACVGLVEAPKQWHILEFKTHSAKSFKELQKLGVETAKPTHYTQMQMYMHWTGMNRAYYMAVNKDNDELYAERVYYAKPHAEAALKRAESIIKAAVPPSGISDDPTWYECRFCTYHGFCFGGKIPLKSCRTCLHATPILSGGWHCESSAQMGEPTSISTEEQREGCDNHLFIPDLIPATVTDADPEGCWVEYETDSKQFWNCIEGQKGDCAYPSSELQHLSKPMLVDTLINQLREEFNAEVVA